MPIFRRRTLFHAEERLPDQEDLKLRFRRRIVLCALLGFLLILGFPVFRQLHPELLARRETRLLAQLLFDSRLLAAQARAPVALRLNGTQWERSLLTSGAKCGDASNTPVQIWSASNMQWQMKLQRKVGDPLLGTLLCLDPNAGLLLNEEPIADGDLLISAQPMGAQTLRAAHLLISNYGSEVQTITH
jgi:hypothetical protein